MKHILSTTGEKRKIITTSSGKKIYPEGTLFTLLKFEESQRTGAMIGYININKKEKSVKGVRSNAPCHKVVCLVDRSITVEPNVLYYAALIPMRNSKGYIVIEATKRQFKAHINTSYVPRTLYCAELIWGNRRIMFDPFGDGVGIKALDAICKELSQQDDIVAVNKVIEQFRKVGVELLDRARQDGVI
jgi:hypothetical protein